MKIAGSTFFVTGGGSGLGAASSETLVLLESLAALVLFVVVLLAWIVPHERAALTFTEAEIAFLFPAPINRRGLIHFKLIRSQVRILFSIFFFTLVFNRFGGSAWMRNKAYTISRIQPAAKATRAGTVLVTGGKFVTARIRLMSSHIGRGSPLERK